MKAALAIRLAMTAAFALTAAIACSSGSVHRGSSAPAAPEGAANAVNADRPVHAGSAAMKGVLLEDLTWVEAEKHLRPETVVVLPIGASTKEHGPHLKLKNDFLIAEYLKRRVLERADVVVAPTIGFHHYPAFLEYPGSVSLRLETARDLVVDICRSLARYGPRRFYALNTGISTVRALAPAAEMLAADGILFRYTELGKIVDPVAKKIGRQEGGSHADEIETSMMLIIAPESVDMTKAVKDYDPNPKGGLSRVRSPDNAYSPTGIWGDPTLATKDKGRILVDALVTGILSDIAAVARAPLPGAP